jgi:disulfide oxidoreductase YuzD
VVKREIVSMPSHMYVYGAESKNCKSCINTSKDLIQQNFSTIEKEQYIEVKIMLNNFNDRNVGLKFGAFCAVF